MGSPATVVASAARTATGNSGALDADGQYLNLLVNVTAASGTSPTLNCSVEWSNDGSTFAAVDGTADTFAQITATTAKVKQFAVKAAYYRVVWTIAGTSPSFTFSVSQLAIP